MVKVQGIRIYQPPIDAEDEAAAEHARILIDAMPFSIIGSTEDVTTKDGRVGESTTRGIVGKVLLAHAPQQVCDEVLGSLTRITPWSVGYCGVPIAVVPGADLNAVSEECCRVAARELADLLDPAFETDVIFTAFTAYGTQGEVRLHVRRDVVCSTAQDRLARALSGRPWLASCV